MRTRHSQNKVKGYVFNLKLTSQDRHGEDTIGGLLMNAFNRRIIKPVNIDREMLIRTAYRAKIDGSRLIFGSFASGIDLSNSIALDLNDPTTDINTPLSNDLRVKVLTNEFVYVERAHRLFFIRKAQNNIPRMHVEYFLGAVLTEVVENNESIEVIIEKDVNSIEYILSAQRIDWIEVQITRSNNDTNEDSAEWLQNEMDEARSNKLNIKVGSDNPGGVNPQAKLVEGALRLAPSNGRAQAKIVDADGNRARVDTQRYVRDFVVRYFREDERLYDIARMVMQLFRNG